MLKKILARLLPAALLTLLIAACVDTYDITINASKKYLIVEGTITNVPDQKQTVRLFETDDQSEFVSTEFTKTIVSPNNQATPIINAKVNVIENGTQEYTLAQTEPGVFSMPNGFFAQIGNTYQLKVVLADGRKYTSSIQKMNDVPAIKNFTIKYNPIGIKTARLYNIQIPTHDFFVEFDDPSTEQNFYSWTWADYEIQKICSSCRGGLYTKLDGTATSDGTCVPNNNLPGNNLFDYYCDGFCWEIFESTDINLFSDNFTNGQSQRNKLVAQIPVLQKNTCLVTIQQKSLTPEAFRYLRLLQEQSVNSGSLADTPPAPIRSNVSNDADVKELVLGFFTASAVTEVRHMLSRSDAPGAIDDRLFGVLNNRDPIPEPDGVYRPLVPLALCKQSSNRTPNAPRNWQFGQ